MHKRFLNIVLVVVLTVVAVAGLMPTCVHADSGAPTIVNATHPHDGVAAHKGDFNYLRTQPDRHAAIIEKMHEGTPFKIIAFASGGTAEDGYYQIVLQDGTTGWTAAVNVRMLD